MLVLGRKENESIIIGNSIRITIVGRCGSSIKLGVEAPADVRVWREELRTAETPMLNREIDCSSYSEPSANPSS